MQCHRNKFPCSLVAQSAVFSIRKYPTYRNLLTLVKKALSYNPVTDLLSDVEVAFPYARNEYKCSCPIALFVTLRVWVRQIGQDSELLLCCGSCSLAKEKLFEWSECLRFAPHLDPKTPPRDFFLRIVNCMRNKN